MILPDGVTVQGEKFYSFPRTNKKVGIIDFEEADGANVTKIGICYGTGRNLDIPFIYRNGTNFNEE